MATVVFDTDAVRDLEARIATHELPGSTKERVRDPASQLATFPLSGRRLTGEGAGARFILGPWPWMILGLRLQRGRGPRGDRRYRGCQAFELLGAPSSVSAGGPGLRVCIGKRRSTRRPSEYDRHAAAPPAGPGTSSVTRLRPASQCVGDITPRPGRRGRAGEARIPSLDVGRGHGWSDGRCRNRRARCAAPGFLQIPTG